MYLATKMKSYYIQWRLEPARGPMSFWVHDPVDGEPFYSAGQFDPPFPKGVPGRGYPYFFVEIDGFTFEFASLAELDECIRVLSKRMLPDTTAETKRKGTGPGAHWLNKLPKQVKPWRYRVKAVVFLAKARLQFEEELRF